MLRETLMPNVSMPESLQERERIITLLKQQVEELTAQRDYWRDLAISKQQQLEGSTNANRQTPAR